MYPTTARSPMLVKIVDNQQTNSQPRTPARNFHQRPHDATNSAVHRQTNFNAYRPNVAANNRQAFMQTGSYRLEVLQLMRWEIPSSRATDCRMQNSGGGNWQRRASPSSNNQSIMPPPNHPNFRPDFYNGGPPNRKQNWTNRANKRNVVSREILTTKKEAFVCDSGFNSRSTTPSKNRGDNSQAESSDERDSVSSSIDQENKVLHEVNENQSVVNHVNTAQGGLPTVAVHQQYFPNQRNPLNYNNNANAMRPQTQNYPGKKRYHAGRNTPPSQRNQKGRRFASVVLPPCNMLPRSYVAPDRFLARSHLVQVHVAPDDLYSVAAWNQLSHDIWTKFMAHQQTETTFRNKMLLWKNLYFCIKNTFPRYGLFLVGSTMSGFGSDNSDVDLCLLVRHTEIIHRSEAINHLQQLLTCLKDCDYVENLEVIKAKVPILKFRDYMRNLEVDLNCNNAVGIRNTHLLHCYSQLDWRVRPLVVVIKLWAQCQDINDAKNMTISSYSLVLMVIHFLQCGLNPCVLPCLHAVYPTKFNPGSDIHAIDIHEELHIDVNPPNRQPLGELLLEFFKYYAMFDFSKYAISVRLAKKMPIEECRDAVTCKNDPGEWKYLCIEEPFDLTNTARSVYDCAVFARIKQIFVNAYQRLKENRDLGSIFVKTGPRMVHPYPHYAH